MRAPEPSPDEAAEAREEAQIIQNCIAALPARQQQVIHLRFYADDSLEGIAAALGCSVGTVKSRLFHALEKLRRMKALRAPVEQLVTQTAPRTKSAIALALL
jgi:RNA polymerase sigma-70 factor (ECF subfamily)